MVSGGEGNDFKLDPMTFVLCLAPFSAFFTLCGIGVESMYNAIEATDGPKLLERGIENWHFLLLNCLNAFTLNVLSTFVVRRVSAVGFCLCGAVKNIIIIFVSASMLGEEMVMQQVLGYMFALTNVVMYSLSKQVAGVFDDGYCSGVSTLAELACESLGIVSRKRPTFPRASGGSGHAALTATGTWSWRTAPRPHQSTTGHPSLSSCA